MQRLLMRYPIIILQLPDRGAPELTRRGTAALITRISPLIVVPAVGPDRVTT